MHAVVSGSGYQLEGQWVLVVIVVVLILRRGQLLIPRLTHDLKGLLSRLAVVTIGVNFDVSISITLEQGQSLCDQIRCNVSIVEN